MLVVSAALDDYKSTHTARMHNKQRRMSHTRRHKQTQAGTHYTRIHWCSESTALPSVGSRHGKSLIKMNHKFWTAEAPSPKLLPPLGDSENQTLSGTLEEAKSSSASAEVRFVIPHAGLS